MGAPQPVEREAGADPPDGGPPGGWRRWLLPVVASLSAAGAIGLGFLNLFGVATGLVVNLVVVVLLVGAFVASVARILHEHFRDYSPRAKGLLVAGTIGVAVVLVLVGLATRAAIPLHRLTGTHDIAVVGFHASDTDSPQAWEGLGESVASALTTADAGEIHDYSDNVTPPLERLTSSINDGQMYAWANDFVAQTGSELVVGGWEDALDGRRLHVAAYVPADLVPDAVELSGWFSLDTLNLDADLSSTTSRREITDQIHAQVGALSTFTNALDEWHSGHPAEAARNFRLVKLADPNQSKTLVALSRLLRGHALESQAAISSPANKISLLHQARTEYESARSSAVLARRVDLSIATNDYLELASTACTPQAGLDHELTVVSHRLAAIAATRPDELVSLRADANRALVQLCRAIAGATDAYQVAEPILRRLTTLQPAGGVTKRAADQIRSSALSTLASLLGERREYAAAASAIEQAITLDNRFERQALWLGLESRWLLLDCKRTAGEAAQQRSLDKLNTAISRGRVPQGDRTEYEREFARELADAQSRCIARQ